MKNDSQKTKSVNKLGVNMGGVDLNREYHFRHDSGIQIPGDTNAPRQDAGASDQPDNTSRTLHSAKDFLSHAIRENIAATSTYH